MCVKLLLLYVWGSYCMWTLCVWSYCMLSIVCEIVVVSVCVCEVSVKLLYVKFVCVWSYCMLSLCVWNCCCMLVWIVCMREAAGGGGARDTESKTRTPHKDVGKKRCWKFSCFSHQQSVFYYSEVYFIITLLQSVLCITNFIILYSRGGFPN